MPTVETSIWQALRARAATIPGSFAISWPLEGFTPPSAGSKQLPYLEVRHLPNANVRRFVGSDDPHERPGILQVTLMWPAADVGTGSGKTHPDVVIQQAGEIAAHFPAGLPLDFEGVRLHVERAPDIAQPFRDEAYWRVPISVRYFAFA